MTSTETPNPIVKTTHLRAYPEWIVREYRNGMFDAVHTNNVSPAISTGCATFAEAVAYVSETR